MNKIEIIPAKTKEDCEICDKFLSKLIAFESKIDNNIMQNVEIKNMHEKKLNNAYHYMSIAKLNNVPVGFVYGHLKTPKGLTTLKSVLEVSTLYVEQDFRNQGVGKALMKDFENWAKTNYDEDCLIEIMYINNNENAQKFYQKLGYLPIRTTLRK